MERNDVVDILNDLVETSKDGEYGFRTCAEHAQSPTLSTAFSQRAEECASAATELQALVVRYGGAPDTSGSISGALHRAWTNVRGTFSLNDDKAMLNECERGEDAALDRYRAAMAHDLPADVLDVVQRQCEGVQRNHDQIKAMRDQYAQRVA